MTTGLPCALCKVVPELVDPHNPEPYGADIFRATGHYGSTRYDPPMGEHLRLLICASCLDALTAEGVVQRVLQKTDTTPESVAIFRSAEDTDPDNPGNRIRIANDNILSDYLDANRRPDTNSHVIRDLFTRCRAASEAGKTFHPIEDTGDSDG